MTEWIGRWIVMLEKQGSNLDWDMYLHWGHYFLRPSAIPAKILSPFLSTAPLQYVLKILFTQATIDSLTTNKTKNALHKEAVISNYIGGDPISHGLSN